MKIAKNITELIGNTPLVELKNYQTSIQAQGNIIGKLESYNPASSVKDRIGFAMIQDGIEKKQIDQDTVIVEPTSGNTGIGLAFTCAALGYRLIIIMPETASIERRSILKTLGAELVLTPGNKGMKGAIAKAEEIMKEHPKSYMPQQFKNPANPEIHRKTTGMEILRDTEGKVDVLVAGVGTGGTITGVGETLKKNNPKVKIVAVEPKDSPVLSGGEPGPHKIQGIGAGFIPEILNREIIDEVIQVENEQAFETLDQLAKTEGLLVGISSGAALYAAGEVAKRKEYKDKNIVVILPDGVERYLSILSKDFG